MKKPTKNTTTKYDDNCIFCKIINGKVPSKKVFEDDDVLAILDIRGDYENHTLVMPKQHIDKLTSADENIIQKLFYLIKKVSNSYISSGYDGVNILVNNGESAEQTIMHLHIHIIPRKAEDGLKIFPQRKNS